MRTRNITTVWSRRRHVHGWPIVRALGQGGMGRVFEVEDRSGNRWAVKTLMHQYAPADVARLRREADLTSRVDHPNVIRVAHADLAVDPPYILTELLDGPTLHRFVTDGDDIGTSEVVDIARGLARGMIALHDAGIVHRDLTPTNVILTDRGPCVIDFGVAVAADVTQLTQVDATPGTPAWMAPERAGGAPATAATDVYGWGRLVAFAATGRVVPGPDDIDTMMLPEPLDSLVRRALDPDPSERPSVVDVSRWAGPADRPVPALPKPSPPRSTRSIVAGAVGVVAAGSLAWSGVAVMRDDDRVPAIDTVPTDPVSGTAAEQVPAVPVGGDDIMAEAADALEDRDIPVPDGATIESVSPSGNLADGLAHGFSVPRSRSVVVEELRVALTGTGWSGTFVDYVSPTITVPGGMAEVSSDGMFERADGERIVVFVTDGDDAGSSRLVIEVGATVD